MNPISDTEKQAMLTMAQESMQRAYVPYSHFRVGACIKASSGAYYHGCNIENAGYTPTNCAERTAIFGAIYAGERAFDGIAIACSGNVPAFPCGVCRQVLSEFCDPDMPVICADKNGKATETTLGELLPFAFGPKDLL